MNGWRNYAEATARVSPTARARARERLERTLAVGAPSHGRHWLAPALAAACAVLLAVVVGLWPEVEPTGMGTVALRTTDRPQTVELPYDGTLRVGRHSRVTVAVDDETGALVELEAGAVTLSVHQQPGARWRVRVGDYEVEAVGTQFRVLRTDSVPEVEVYQGVVHVTGPGLPADGLRVRAEDARELDPDGPDATAPAARVDLPGTADALPNGALPDDTAPDSAAPDSAAPDSAAPDDAAPDSALQRVQALESRGKRPRWVATFRAAVRSNDAAAAVEALPAGFPTGRERIRADDYVDAGDLLTSRGDRRRANRSYRAACDRAARSDACGIALFRLSLAHARAGELDKAVALADRYLAKHAKGAFVRDVFGRRMQWRSTLGQTAAARADATVYLARWKGGPHAALARTLAEDR